MSPSSEGSCKIKDFAEFERLWENEFRDADRRALTAEMEERYDEKLPHDGMRELVVAQWVEQRMPLRMLARYHEWLQG